VTDHDAFGYFSEAYDFEVAGVVIPGGSTLAEPSSEEFAGLVEVVREAGVRAVFANTAHRTVLIEALCAEVGDVAVVELYVDSLGAEGSGAEDYAGMMLTDARLVAQALSG
jgi:zinc/manganese transport system substrate-binding protein